MQELLERKKEAQKEGETEKKPLSHKPLSLSMSEGPMHSLSESRKIEEMGRASYEKSVKTELASMLMRKRKKPSPNQKGKGQDGKPDPPRGR